MYLYNLISAILMFLVPILIFGGAGVLGGSIIVFGIKWQNAEKPTQVEWNKELDQLISEASRNKWKGEDVFNNFQKSIEGGAEISSIDCFGASVLSNLAYNLAPPKFFQYLLDKSSIEPDILSETLHTIIDACSRDKHSDRLGYNSTHQKQYLELFLQKGADLNFKNASKQISNTTLDLVLLTDSLECIQFLLEKQCLTLDHQNSNGQTMLHLAAPGHNIEIIKFLCEAKADPNIQDAKGRTPLHLAAEQHNIEIIKFLCEAKADPNIQDKLGRTPLYFLIDKLFRTTRDDNYTVLTRQGRNIKIMLDSGASLDIVDKGGNNPLHHAVSQYQPCKRIIDFSRDSDTPHIPTLLLTKASHIEGYIDRQNQEGDTVLHMSLGKGYTTLVQLLLSKGARVDIMNNKGELPLDIAIDVYQSKEIDYLPIIEELIFLTKHEMIEGCLEKIKWANLREHLNRLTLRPIKSARFAGSRQEEKVEEKVEEVDKEKKEEKAVVEEVEKVTIAKWRWDENSYLKSQDTITNYAMGNILTTGSGDNLVWKENPYLKSQDAILHKVFDELGYVPKAFYNQDFAQLTLSGSVLPKE